MGKGDIGAKNGGQSREGGYRSWGARMMSGSRTVREVPHAGLVMLKADGSNMTAWSAALNNHLIATYGQMANFITTAKLVKRTPPTVEEIAKTLGERAETKIDKLLLAAQQDYLKILRQDANDYGAIFGLIQQVVTDEGMERVMALEVYEQVREQANPLMLYHLIRRVHSLQMDRRSDEDAKYIAIQRYHAIRQLAGCTLGDYKSAFDMAVMNLHTLGVKPMPTPEDQARHFLMNLDRAKYGEFIKSTLNDEGAGKGVFPKTVQAVVSGARAFLPIQRPVQASTPTAYSTDVQVCYRCQKPGHYARECPEKKKNDSGKSVASSDGGKREVEVAGTKKKKKAQQKRDYSGHATEVDPFPDFFGYAIDTQPAKSKQPRAVSIDSLANHSFGWDESIFDSVHDEEFSMSGVGGRSTGTKMGRLPCFGPVAITPHARVNAIALCDAEQYEVEYVQGVKYTVKVSDELTLTFHYCESDKSYTCLFTDEVLEALRSEEASIGIHTATVAANEANYSKAEVTGARLSRQLMKRLYYPPDATLVKMLTHGRILNAPVTPHDVIRATDIYGKDVASLKGRTTYKGPVKTDVMVIPKSIQKEQDVHADIFHWENNQFILFVLKPLQVLLVQWLPSTRTSADMIDAVNKLLGKVRARGFVVRYISSDPEKALAKLDGLVDADWDTVGSRSHEEHAEREIRLIKERLRAAQCGLPFRVANRLVRWMVYGCVSAINATRVTEDGISPREAFTGIKLDFKRDVRAAFGDYAQVSVATGNNSGSRERTIGAIALCPTGNRKGTFYFLDLKTGGEIRADHWTPLPMPDIVIEVLNQMADHDDIPASRRPMANLVPGERRGRKPNVQQNDEESPVAVSQVQLQEGGTPDFASLVEMPTPATSPADTDSGPFEESDGIAPTADDLPSTAEVASGVISQLADPKDEIIINRLSIKRAVAKYGVPAEEAITKEVSQMLDRGVFELVSRSSLTPEQSGKIIRSSIFLKEKYLPNGDFQKIKARLVAGGDQQDKSLYSDTSSPTAALESTMMVIAVAAAEGREVATCDVTGAFLEAEMPDDQEVFMVLEPAVARVVIKLKPEAKSLLTPNGTMLVRLRRALYGCVQSSKLWYNKLCSVLREDGFEMNPYDSCVFNKSVDGVQITVCFHVDDLLMTSKSSALIDALSAHLQRSFTEVTFTRGAEHSFLSMTLECQKNGISVDMRGYVEKCLTDRKVANANSPARDDLFETDVSSSPLSDEDREAFHSDVAKLLYLAKRVRKDILVSVSYLCSRVAEPTEDDQRKLMRVLGYLSKTRDLKTFFQSGDVILSAHIDASFGTHDDGSSRTGVILMLGGAAVGAWSSKQKIVTKSSTEAELVGLSDGATMVLWAREFLLAQGHSLSPTVIGQDNQGVLSLMDNGRHGNQRTKHLNIRYFFVKDRINSGELSLMYIPTKQMIADLLTKPLNGALFIELRGLLLGVTEAM